MDTREKKRRQTETEDAPASTKRRRRLSVKARRLLVFLAIGLVILFVALNWQWLSPVAILQRVQAAKSEKGVVLEYPLDIAQRVITGFSRMGDDGFVVTDAGCLLLTDKCAYSYTHSLTSPYADIGSRYALLYESGGTDYLMHSVHGRLFSLSADSTEIRAAAVAENGAYAVVTAPTVYSAKLVVYSTSHTALFSQFLASPKITGVCLDASASRCAVVERDTENGQLVSRVTVYHLSETDPVFETALDDWLVTEIAFDQTGRLCVVGDRGACYYAADYKPLYALSYEGDLTAYCLDREDGSLAVLLDSGNVTAGRLVLLLDAGGERWRAAVSYRAGALTACGNSVCYIDSGEAVLLTGGTEIGRVACALDTDDALLTPTCVYLTGKAKLYRIALQAFTDTAG